MCYPALCLSEGKVICPAGWIKTWNWRCHVRSFSENGIMAHSLIRQIRKQYSSRGVEV
jgi:hypothetical protein